MFPWLGLPSSSCRRRVQRLQRQQLNAQQSLRGLFMARSLGGVRRLVGPRASFVHLLPAVLIVLGLGLTTVRVLSQDSFPQIVQLTNNTLGFSPGTHGLTRDGSVVVFTAGNVLDPQSGRLFSVPSDGTVAPIPITPSDLNVVRSHFGGTKAAFVACQSPCGWDNLGHPGDVYVVNADGTGLTQLTADGVGPISYEVVSISSDGRKVVTSPPKTPAGETRGR